MTIDGEAWKNELSARVGNGVHTYRQRIGMTAQQLSERCTELGFSVTRASIAKIESNSRRGKVDVSELLILAEALRVSPSDLLYFGHPGAEVEPTPSSPRIPAQIAISWFLPSGGVRRAGVPSTENSQELHRAIEGLNDLYMEIDSLLPPAYYDVLDEVPHPDAELYTRHAEHLLKTISESAGVPLTPWWLGKLTKGNTITLDDVIKYITHEATRQQKGDPEA